MTEKLKKSNNKLYIIFEYLMVAVGCFVMAYGFNAFCVPNSIAPGGFSGLATVLHILTGFPTGLANTLMCAPLFIIMYKDMGKTSLFKTIYGTLIFSFFLDMTVSFPAITHDMLLAAVFGGIILGIGIGIVFKFRGSTGGTDLLALLLHKRFNGITMGNMVMAIDFIVVAIAGLVLKQIEVSLYSIIAIYVSMKMIDLVQEGMNYVKAFYIFTEAPEEITSAIFEYLDRGVTFLNATGGYSKEKRDILLCVVNRTQVNLLKGLVKEIDPKAFVFVADVHEALGEGFKEGLE